MARVYKSFGQTFVQPTEDEWRKLDRDRQFRVGMGRVSSNLDSNLSNAARSGVGATAAMLVGGGVLTYGAIRSKKIRYVLQAILHLPFSWILAWSVCLYVSLRWLDADSADSGSITMDGFTDTSLKCWIAASVISIVWTALYVCLRTVPKWRRLVALERRAQGRPFP